MGVFWATAKFGSCDNNVSCVSDRGCWINLLPTACFGLMASGPVLSSHWMWWWIHWEVIQNFWREVQRTFKSTITNFEHQNITGHTASVEKFKIISRKGQNMARAIKETIYIRVNNPTLNRNIGKYNLPHIWDKVLFSFSELKKKKTNKNTSTHLCLKRFTNNKDLCTKTSVP